MKRKFIEIVMHMSADTHSSYKEISNSTRIHTYIITDVHTCIHTYLLAYIINKRE